MSNAKRACSRSGATMAGGLLVGLSHKDAARFAFLLATPVIFAAGVYKVPDLFGPLGDGIRGQVLVGSLVAFAAWCSHDPVAREEACRSHAERRLWARASITPAA